MARRYTGAAAGGRASKGVATSSSSAPLASLADLRSDPRNPRTIAPKALAGLGYAMAEFGDLSGITFNARTGELVAGHQRVRSLRDRFGDLPIVVLPGDVDGERRGVIRDPEGHAWDVRIVDWPREKQLAANLQANNAATAGDFTADVGALLAEVEAGMPDLFAACLFDDLQASVDAALAEAGKAAEGTGASGPPGEAEEDEAPPVAEGEPDSRQGEAYQLGPHRLVCGDCRAPGAWGFLAGERVNLAFTSPPYASQRKYDEASGFKPIHPDAYGDWWEAVQAGVRGVLAEDGSFFVNIKAASSGLDTELYALDLVLAHARKWGWHFAAEFVWQRVGIPGKPARRFKNQHEPIYQFALGEWKFRPESVAHPSENVPTYSSENHWAHGLKNAAGSSGAGWKEVRGGMAYPGNLLPVYGQGSGEGHSAAFPVALPDFFIRAFSDPGDLVADPFMGSGTTLIAAHQRDRRAVGFEISPRYCDVIRRRWTRWAAAHGQDPGPGGLEG